MACQIDEILADACENGFSCLPSLREYDIVIAQLLCDLKDSLAGGISGVSGVYSGHGDPTGVVVPSGSAAVYFDEDSGTQWNYYDGVWH
jgi:hypothetical protein